MRIPSLTITVAFACLSCMLLPNGLWAAPSFPRGSGLYYDPFKLGTLIVSFLGWVKLCAWVDLDASRYRLEGAFYNGLILLAGLVGFGIIWNLPSFWLAWILGCGLVGGVTGWYLVVRNRRADEGDQ